MRWIVLLSMLLELLLSPARADDLAPMLDEHTYAVLGIDLQQIDTVALGRWVVDRTQLGLETPAERQRASEIGSGMARIGTVIALLRGQGVRRVYFVFDARLIGTEWPVIMAIPCSEQIGRRLAIQAGLMQLGTRVGQGWLIAGKHDGLAALQDFQPAMRDDLLALLREQRGVIAGAIQPTPVARRALESLLPPMDDIVNGEVGAIIGGFEAMSLDITAPPAVDIKVQLRVTDAVSADNYQRFFGAVLNNAPPERRAAMELLVPRREGLTFELAVDTAKLDTILQAVRP
jgi:hypothetical protein